jgi:hypothetical protein
MTIKEFSNRDDFQNYSNMVWFYSNELRKVLNGTSVHECLSRQECRKLRKYGILEHMKYGRSRYWVVTELAKALLEE